ncbi:MAG: PDZ domain-containing protein [Gemmataceae bacterium]|nr:PDZ domain-containing protein [Gemmataceae bacterium]
MVGGTPAAPAPPGVPPALAAGVKFAEVGKVDRYVATSGGWDLPADDPRLWQPAFDLAQRLSDKSGVRFGWGPDQENYFLFTTVARYRELTTPSFHRTDRPHRQRDRNDAGMEQLYWPEAVIAPEFTSPHSMGRTAAIVRGSVRVKHVLGDAIVFATGDVTMGDNCSGAVVVADGDVEVGGNLYDSLIVARGDIRVRKIANCSGLFAGGRVTIGQELPDQPDETRSFVRDDDVCPFGFVTWFDLEVVGIDAAKADGGVAVKAVAAGKPFAKAGVQVGDLVTKVGEHAVTTPEEFRRRLRDAHAVAAEATLTARRDGQPVTVRVPLPR